MDGFEMYGADGATGTALQTELQKVYDYANTTTVNPDAYLRTGWHGGLCLEWTDDDTSSYLVKYLDTTADTFIIGFAFRSGIFNEGDYLITLLDATNTQQASLFVNAYGQLQITSRNVGVGALTFPFRNDQWYYLEWKLYCHHTNGTTEIRINGETVYTIAAHDSYYNALPTRIKIHSLRGGSNRIDDIYVCDDTGTAFNDFLGPQKIENLAPTSDDTAEWTPSAAVSHYTLVDDLPDDADTTYVSDNLWDNTDLFGYANTTYDDVTAVTVFTRSRLEDAGSLHDLVMICDTGTVATDTHSITSTSYGYSFWVMEAAPGGGSWSATTFNSAKFGFKIG
jgi:hypothetical protein